MGEGEIMKQKMFKKVVVMMLVITLIMAIPTFVAANGNPNKDNTWVVFQNQRVVNGQAVIDMVVRDYGAKGQGSGGIKTVKYSYANGRGVGQYPASSTFTTITVSETNVMQRTFTIPVKDIHNKFIFVQVEDYGGLRYAPSLGFGPYWANTATPFALTDISIVRFFDPNIGKYCYDLLPVFSIPNPLGVTYSWQILSGGSLVDLVNGTMLTDDNIILAAKGAGGSIVVRLTVQYNGQSYSIQETMDILNPIMINVDEQYAKVKEVNVTLSYFAEATQRQYKLGEEGTWINYTAPFKVNSNTTVYARCLDSDGNEIIASREISNIDNIIPTAEVEFNTTSPTNQNVVATLIPSEAIIVTNNNGSLSRTFTENGSFTFDFRDAAGNTTTKTVTVTNIDKAAPTGTVTLSTTAPTNQNVTATLTPSEAVTVTNNNGSLVYDFTQNGSFTFQYRDAAGNTGSSTVTVNNIDKIAPTATVTYSIEGLTGGTVRATLANISEAITVTSPSNGATYYDFNMNGEYTFQFRDAAGNTGTAIAVVNNILSTNSNMLSRISLTKGYKAGDTSDENITSVIQGGSLEFRIKLTASVGGKLKLALESNFMDTTNPRHEENSQLFFDSLSIRELADVSVDGQKLNLSISKATDGSRYIILESAENLVVGKEYEIKIVVKTVQQLPIGSYELKLIGSNPVQRLQIDVVKLPPLL